VINIRLLEQTQKKELKGGSFYAIALGIGILVSTIASLAGTIVDSCRPNQTTSYSSRRSHALIRLSPVPSRSSITII